MPDFQLTLVPFLYEADPDSSILEITAGMASDPEGHAATGAFAPAEARRFVLFSRGIPRE